MRPDIFVIYRKRLGHRWRRVTPNGRIVERSSTWYVSRWNAKRAAKRAGATEGTIVIER